MDVRINLFPRTSVVAISDSKSGLRPLHTQNGLTDTCEEIKSLPIICWFIMTTGNR